MFWGLMSRCSTPAACSAATASAMSAITAAALPTGSAAWSSGLPSTRFITMKSLSSWRPTSSAWTRCGCRTLAEARASRRKRSRAKRMSSRASLTPQDSRFLGFEVRLLILRQEPQIDEDVPDRPRIGGLRRLQLIFGEEAVEHRQAADDGAPAEEAEEIADAVRVHQRSKRRRRWASSSSTSPSWATESRTCLRTVSLSSVLARKT